MSLASASHSRRLMLRRRSLWNEESSRRRYALSRCSLTLGPIPHLLGGITRHWGACARWLSQHKISHFSSSEKACFHLFLASTQSAINAPWYLPFSIKISFALFPAAITPAINKPSTFVSIVSGL